MQRGHERRGDQAILPVAGRGSEPDACGDEPDELISMRLSPHPKLAQTIADLAKMVIHYKEYVLQKFGDEERLLGADVIVPHRMLKNHVTETTGIACYASFSEEAAQAPNPAELAHPLVPYSESYVHIGEVKMRVLDLHEAWLRERKDSESPIVHSLRANILQAVLEDLRTGITQRRRSD